MNGTLTLYIDQYGQSYYAHTLKELRKKIHGRCSKMYKDTQDGRTLHVGYVIGGLWLRAYRPYQKEVSF